MNRKTTLFSFATALLLGSMPGVALAQVPAPAKGPDKEIAEKIATLRACVQDKKFARDEEGRAIIDALWQKMSAGVDEKDQLAITKALEDVLILGVKVRPSDNKVLYTAAAAALGYCGAEGAKVLKTQYGNKRFPDRKEWVPLREQFLKSIGKTKDESMVAFLCSEAQNHEPALQAAAGEALGNFEESKDTVRKEIVSRLLIIWGSLAEKASQMGSGNMEAQTASDTLAAISDKWNTTLAKLTKQNFRKHADWQAWNNKNKNLPWQ